MTAGGPAGIVLPTKHCVRASRAGAVQCGPGCRGLLVGPYLGSNISGLNTGRISTVQSIITGHFLAHSSASSKDLTSQSAKPATTSFVSVNGPSVTVMFLPVY